MTLFGELKFCLTGKLLGNVNKDVFIDFGPRDELHWGCGATFYGEFWYFGGDYRDNQQRRVSFD